MTDTSDDTVEDRFTTDRQRIAEWVGDYDVIPVRRAGERGGLDILAAANRDQSHERLSWDEFFDALDRAELEVAHRPDDPSHPFEVVDRDRTAPGATDGAEGDEDGPDSETGEARVGGDASTASDEGDEPPRTPGYGDDVVVGASVRDTLLEGESMAKGVRVAPSPDDEGKPVFDADGEEVGEVASVEGNAVYVNPHPSLADKLGRVLGMREASEGAYPVDARHIARITDDRVELDVEG